VFSVYYVCNGLEISVAKIIIIVVQLKVSFAEHWSLLWGSFAKETWDFKEPTNRSLPISRMSRNISPCLSMSLLNVSLLTHP